MTAIQARQLSLFEQREREFTPPPETPIDTFFPEEGANDLAKAESFNKHLYRPNSYLHKWWARRSGTTFRHILKQLVPDPDKRDFLEPGGLEGAVILDPMMGGGTTLHEAVRLGANCVGIDIDPIPVLQVKATLADLPLADKEAVFADFMTKLRDRIASVFVTECPECETLSEIGFTLYALKRRCACGQVAIVDSFVLRHGQSESIRICPFCGSVFRGEHICDGAARTDLPLIERGQGSCPTCGQRYQDITEVPFYDRYIPIAIAGRCPIHGEFFKALAHRDKSVLAERERSDGASRFFDPNQFEVPTGEKSDDLSSRGVRSYLDLFTRRQLLYLSESIKIVQQMPDQHRLWMALLLSTSLEFNCLLCGYKGADIKRPGAIRHVFSHHAYSFPYTALENNPVSLHGGSGTMLRLFRDRVVKANRWAMRPVERSIVGGKQVQIAIDGERDSAILVDCFPTGDGRAKRAYIRQADFRSFYMPAQSVDHVVTDPPYYDSVQYSDLSNFFRVWLSRLLPDQADWHYDTRNSVVAHDSVTGRAYGDSLAAIWGNCHAALRRPHGRLIFTFHHWKSEAWAELTLSLRRAGFFLVNRFAIHSENPISVHIRNLRALTHDCILVLTPERPNSAEPRRWLPPSRVDTTNSRLFCLNCGDVLGYLLDSSISENDVRETWQDLFKD